MNTNISGIKFGNNYRPPGGTELKVFNLGTFPASVKAEVKLPGQKNWKVYERLSIENGEIYIPIKKVFLCCAEENSDFVDSVQQRLYDDGIMTFFYKDIKSLPAGANNDNYIQKAIETSDFVIPFLSKSMCGKTGYVQKELKWIKEQIDLRPESKRYALPVVLEQCDIPRFLSGYNLIETKKFQDWYDRLRYSIQDYLDKL
jgi:hypothetical protein